jgi:hypothetical protein
MAFTQKDLDEINELIASAISESETADGKRVRFVTDLKALKERKAMILQEMRGTRKTPIGLWSPGCPE